jgi:fluoride exporter
MSTFIVFLGGGLGAAARYSAQGLVHRWMGAEFPFGTMAVNITGSFAIGLLMTLLEDRFMAVPELRLFLTVGILGGYTTFSSFSFETMSMMSGGNYLGGAMNILGSLIGCLAATWLGMIVGKIV